MVPHLLVGRGAPLLDPAAKPGAESREELRWVPRGPRPPPHTRPQGSASSHSSAVSFRLPLGPRSCW